MPYCNDSYADDSNRKCVAQCLSTSFPNATVVGFAFLGAHIWHWFSRSILVTNPGNIGQLSWSYCSHTSAFLTKDVMLNG